MIAGILLAAGSSARFGGDKLQYVLDDGRAIGAAAAQSLLQAVSYCVAVVPHDDSRRAQLFSAAGCEIVYAPPQPFGMGTSLACGARALPPCASIVVALADMPWVESTTVLQLCQALISDANIVVPYYRGVRGHPVAFGARWRRELEALSGDEGARAVLRRHAQHVIRLACADAGVLRDIDTRTDLDVTDVARDPLLARQGGRT